MRKKLFASSLAGSVVIGANSVLLSAQAMATGNTSARVEFSRGALPDGDGVINTVRPGPDATSDNFNLLYIPVNISSDKTAISGDPSSIKSSSYASYGVGDLRGAKGGQHVTVTILGVTNGKDKLISVVSFSRAGYALYYNKVDSDFKALGISSNNPVTPEFPAIGNIIAGSSAILMGNTVSGKSRGLWNSCMVFQRLNITTSCQQLRAGTYTGNITRSLAIGPPI